MYVNQLYHVLAIEIVVKFCLSKFKLLIFNLRITDRCTILKNERALGREACIMAGT